MRESRGNAGIGRFCCFNIYFFVAKKPSGKAPEFTTLLYNLTVVEGEPAMLQCEIKGEPTPVIEWFKDDDEQVAETNRVKMEFDGKLSSLTFEPSKLDDEGDYKCVARNELGSASSKAELLVNEADTKPVFTEKLENVVAKTGEEVQFEVRVIGSPPPEVDWFKGENNLEDDSRILMVDNVEEDLFSLIIEDAQPSDSGEYECVASNTVGEVSCKAKLVVEETIIAPQFGGEVQSAAPVFLEEPIVAPEFTEKGESEPIVSEEGGDVTLSVDVKGQPKPDVQWFKDDEEVRLSEHVAISEVDDKHALLINDATPKDSGTYKCKASNVGGVAERTFDLQVAGKHYVKYHLNLIIEFYLNSK